MGPHMSDERLLPLAASCEVRLWGHDAVLPLMNPLHVFVGLLSLRPVGISGRGCFFDMSAMVLGWVWFSFRFHSFICSCARVCLRFVFFGCGGCAEGWCLSLVTRLLFL